MQSISTKAIILDRQNFRENDLKVTLYTQEFGKLDLIARGALKQSSKMAGHLEPMNIADVMIVAGKQFNYIGSIISRNCFVGIKIDYNKIIMVGKCINIFNKLVKLEHKDEKIFYFLENFLFCAEKKKTLPNIIYSFFSLKLLSLLGYEPDLYFCIQCGEKLTKLNNKFNYEKSGILCNNHKKYSLSNSIDDGCIKLLRAIIKFDFEKILKIKIKKRLLIESRQIINSFIQYKINSIY